MPVDIVTGDRDLFQLVDDEAEVRVLYTARGVGKHERITEHTVVEKYAVLPQQYADFATLRGDSSDGLPGVAGVGDKTAASPAPVVRRPGRHPGGRAGPGVRPRPRAARQDHRRAPTTSRSPRRSSPWPATSTSARRTTPSPREPADPDALAALAERWGLSSPVERLTGVLAAR